MTLPQRRQMLRQHQQPNAAPLARRPLDQAIKLQSLDHLVNRGRGNLEIPLQIGLRGCLAVNLRIVIDEHQILTLFRREWWGHGGIAPRYRLYRYFEGVFAETVKDADFENRKTSPEDAADGFPVGRVEVLP